MQSCHRYKIMTVPPNYCHVEKLKIYYYFIVAWGFQFTLVTRLSFIHLSCATVPWEHASEQTLQPFDQRSLLHHVYSPLTEAMLKSENSALIQYGVGGKCAHFGVHSSTGLMEAQSLGTSRCSCTLVCMCVVCDVTRDLPYAEKLTFFLLPARRERESLHGFSLQRARLAVLHIWQSVMFAVFVWCQTVPFRQEDYWML